MEALSSYHPGDDVQLYEMSRIGTKDHDMDQGLPESTRAVSVTTAAASVAPSEIEPVVNVQELPAVDTSRQAWVFCMSAFALETMIWGFSFSYGIFQTYYTSHPPFDKSSHLAISVVGPITLAMMFGSGIIHSFFHGRYPDQLRTTMWAGLGLYTLCLFASSFASQVSLLILLQGAGLGIGGGMIYWPVINLVSEWFVQRRGLAGGIIFAGSGVGGFAFPFLANALLDRVGFRWTLRIWALFELAIAGIALLGIQPRIPLPKFRRGQRRPPFIPARVQFVKRPVFWTYSATNLLQAMSYFPVALYIAVFTTSISSPLSATVVLALFNVSGVVGQILIGYLTDRYPYPWIMFGSTFASAISAFLLWGFADTLARVFAFAIIFGSLAGGFPSVAFAAAKDSADVNPEQAPMALTAFMFVKGIAAIVGPIVSGVLLQAGQSSTLGSTGPYGKFGFGPVEIFVGSCAAATSISSLVVAATRPGSHS